MTDTPDDIYRKQFDIFFAKPLHERLRLNFEMTEFVREANRRRILRENPDMSSLEVKQELFRQFYAEDFSPADMNKILDFLEQKSE